MSAAIAIIPARGGSRRIPFKNRRHFHGKPILQYSIEAAIKSRLFRHVYTGNFVCDGGQSIYVSSDDAEIFSIAAGCGAWAQKRPDDLSRDEVGTQEVIKALSVGCPKSDIMCCIYPTAPMMTAQDLIDGYDALVAAGSKYVYIHGWFYFGLRGWFLEDRPLSEGIELPHPEGRWIDINTPEDWARAEEMYAALHKTEVAAG